MINKLENLYGKTPGGNTNNNNVSNLNTAQLEPISFYYLNLIKNENKRRFYTSNNILERVDW